MATSDRMPPLAPERMTALQRDVAEELAAGRRGALYGPFVPLLRSPELTRRLQKVGEYLRYEPALPPPLREMAILLVAREWTQDFEWDVHAPIALAEGLAPAIVEAIAEGRRPPGMSERETIVHDVFLELSRMRTVTAATYDTAIREFGEQGVIDLVALIGYYSTLAMVMNVARTPLPDGRTPVLSRPGAASP